MKVSLVLPIYNEQEILEEVLSKYMGELTEIAKERSGSFEIVAVNDGSTDTTLDILMKEAKKNRNFRVVNFTERFGKQAAITAGMEAASGDVVFLADVDLLNPVGVLTNMIAEHLGGSNIVYAYREPVAGERRKRRWSKFMVECASIVFGIEGRYLGKANIALFSRAATDVLVAVPNKNKYLRTMDNWVGFEVRRFEYASNYSKQEVQAKVREAAQRKRAEGCPVVAREKGREHTPSRIYGICTLILAILGLATFIVLSTSVFDGNLMWILVAFIVFVLLLATGLLLIARSVVVKRIGIVYRPDEYIYEIESVVN